MNAQQAIEYIHSVCWKGSIPGLGRTQALLKAEHTDELVADGKTHLRIDYKVSGIGANSCGPELMNKYRLHCLSEGRRF